MDPNVKTCTHCEASLPRGARFCGECGHATREVRKSIEEGREAVLRSSQRSAYAIIIVFVGALLSVLIAAGFAEETSAAVLIVGLSLQAVSGAVALRFLDSTDETGRARGGAVSSWRDTFRACTPRIVQRKWCLIAVGVGVAIYAVARLYVSMFVDSTIDGIAFEVVVIAVLVVPVVEEWLCRGVLWSALNRIASPEVTLPITAILFAALHGLQGGWFAYPHRFAGGFALGWLRQKSGSLVPSIIAHATWNLLVFAL